MPHQQQNINSPGTSTSNNSYKTENIKNTKNKRIEKLENLFKIQDGTLIFSLSLKYS